tara:strand:+ start:97 stop:531 length:435 start_codon:yes stop_codon:yes gene_type:complete
MIALMGLIPVGMKMMKEAGVNTVGARIANKLLGEVQLSEFDDIQQYNNKIYWFDDMGTQLKKGQEESKIRRIYTAKVEVEEENPQIPGAQPNKFLKRVVVKVSNVLGDEPDFDDPSPDSGANQKRIKKDYRSYWTFIIDTEKDD